MDNSFYFKLIKRPEVINDESFKAQRKAREGYEQGVRWNKASTVLPVTTSNSYITNKSIKANNDYPKVDLKLNTNINQHGYLKPDCTLLDLNKKGFSVTESQYKNLYRDISGRGIEKFQKTKDVVYSIPTKTSSGKFEVHSVTSNH